MKTVYLKVMLKIDDENVDISEAIQDMEYDFVFNEIVDDIEYNIVRSMEIVDVEIVE